jgi:hypothetical protein
MGTDTTLLAARQDGCEGIEIELDPAYVAIVGARLAGRRLTGCCRWPGQLFRAARARGRQ